MIAPDQVAAIVAAVAMVGGLVAAFACTIQPSDLRARVRKWWKDREERRLTRDTMRYLDRRERMNAARSLRDTPKRAR